MLRVAQFGLGSLGRLECEVLSAIDAVEVVAGADPAPAARRTFEATHDAPADEDYASLLAERAGDVDAVNVATPHALHYEQTRAAIEHECSVHVEKPLATEAADARSIVAAAADRDVVVQVGYQRRFDPRFRRLREAVESGEIGALVGASCFLGQDWIAEQAGTWRTDPALAGGGQLYDSGSHLLDALLWVTDASPRSVSGAIERGGHDVDVHASLSVTLERDGRTVPASVFVTGAGQAGPEPRENLVVWGTEGSAEYGPDGVVVRRDGAAPEPQPVEAADFETLTERKLRAFVDAVAGDGESAVPAEHGAAVIALTEAAYRADERGERVAVDAPEPGTDAPERAERD